MKFVWYAAFLCASFTMLAQEQHIGSVRGVVRNTLDKSPIHGARVSITGTKLGSYSMRDGLFSIGKVPAGVYSLLVSSIGYKALTVSDVVVKPGRTTEIVVELQEIAVQADSVVVHAGFFSMEEQKISSVSLSYEEIRRAPGSGGDISRVLAGMPSVAKVNDTKNSLIVRGGSPTENLFYVNNIAIPNINHFPSQGSSGGPIGILNVDLINTVTFSAGGFAPQFGNALSSVMEIELRKGNKTQTDIQLDLNFAGYGVVAEGPLFTDKASWLLSARRSYLDILVDAFSTGTSVAPRYGDIQSVLSFQPATNHTIDAIVIVSEDDSFSDSVNARENQQYYYGSQYSLQSTAGVNWKYIWADGFSATSLSYGSTTFRDDFFEQGSGLQLVRNRSKEQRLHLRSLHTYAGWESTTLDAGLEWQYNFPSYNNRYPTIRTPDGNTRVGPEFTSNLHNHSLALFAQTSNKLSAQLLLTAGLRADFSNVNNRVSLQPRASLQYKATEATSFTLSVGDYAQQLSQIQIASNVSAQTFPFLKAIHTIASAQTLLDDDIQCKAEVYYKTYSSAPMDSTAPYSFIADESSLGNDFPQPHQSMEATGVARSYGVEFSLQKKLNNGLYGLVAGSYSRSEFQTLQQQWIPRAFDNRFSFSIEAGYKLSPTWEISARWMYAGGAPYTPFNQEQSTAMRTGVLDFSRTNSLRLPNYHSLNIRTDKRINFSNSSIVLYLSVWNVYNRSNVAAVYWNSFTNQQSNQLQFGILPVFGIEWEL